MTSAVAAWVGTTSLRVCIIIMITHRICEYNRVFLGTALSRISHNLCNERLWASDRALYSCSEIAKQWRCIRNPQRFDEFAAQSFISEGSLLKWVLTKFTARVFVDDFHGDFGPESYVNQWRDVCYPFIKYKRCYSDVQSLHLCLFINYIST